MDDRARLNEYMTERSTKLRIRWNEVASRAGMTPQNLLRIRNGEISVTAFAAEGIEQALGWAPGSVEAILSGGEPTLVAEREAELVDPEDRVWDALRVKYEAWRAEKGPDPAWAMLRREATEDIRLIDERRRRHAERDRRDAG